MPDDFIPILDLAPEIELMRKELDAAYHKVMDHGRFIMGPQVKEFEEQAVDYIGTKHTIGVNSGTDALVIALRATGIGESPVDEVITTPFTFFSTAESIHMAGAFSFFPSKNLGGNDDGGLITTDKKSGGALPKTEGPRLAEEVPQ